MKEFKGSSSYVVSADLLRIVNVAIALEKPLLIKGEPGTGKTMLAQAISEALGKKLIIWNIKSTTKAQDGLYVYDTVQRLYDSQFGGEGVDDIRKYIKLGKLGEAFSADEQVILLIDEIDKADLEFPNDLLWELDKMEFYIPETKQTIAAKQRQLSQEFSQQADELKAAIAKTTVTPAENDFKTVTLSAGQTVQVSAGGEALLLSGAASAREAGLTDVTAGSGVIAGGALAVNHLYVSAGDCTIQASGSAKLLVKS